MDPLESLPSDVHYLVYQHFNFKEILQEISQVSKLWYDSAGRSNYCMKKIKLSLKYGKHSVGSMQEQTEEILGVMQNTNRLYQNISIDCRYITKLSSEFWKLLEVLKSSVTELKIKSIRLDDLTPLYFSKLKALKLMYVPSNIRDVLLSSTSSLTQLKLEIDSPLQWSKLSKPDQKSVECIKDCLQRNHLLQEFELHGPTQYHSFFDEDFSSIVRFQLTSLRIRSPKRLVFVTEKNESNFLNFLMTQSNCLKSIFIDVCRPDVIKHIFSRMPGLNSIHLNTVMLNTGMVKELQLGLNERILVLKIPYVRGDSEIIELLAVVPRLELLFIFELSEETMEYVARNMLNLKTLQYCCGGDCINYYNRLKDKCPEVNQNIEIIFTMVDKI